ncbi:MAG: hypothetical protein K8S00_04295 [Bacteroidales bacterium]|nr:hypothetical protein [Bacteroidales bacterium]
MFDLCIAINQVVLRGGGRYKNQIKKKNYIYSNNQLFIMSPPPAIGVSLSLGEYILLIFLIIGLCFLCVFLLNTFSLTTSKLGMYHITESRLERFKNLYVTYLTLLFLLTTFILISTYSFFNMVNDLNVFTFGLATACILLLSIRIYVTTGLIAVEKIEDDEGFDWKQAKERILSTLYSLLVTIIILICFGIILITLDFSSNHDTKINELMSVNFYVNFSFVKLFICSLTFPLVIASVGELLRFITSNIYKHPSNQPNKNND